MPWRAQIDDRGIISRYKDTETGEVISAKEFERRHMMQSGQYMLAPSASMPSLTAGSHDLQAPAGMHAPPAATPGVHHHSPHHVMSPYSSGAGIAPAYPMHSTAPSPYLAPPPPAVPLPQQPPAALTPPAAMWSAAGGAVPPIEKDNPLLQPGAEILAPGATTGGTAAPAAGAPATYTPGQPPTAGQPVQGKNLRMEGVPGHVKNHSPGYRTHGFLDATSIAILLPTLVLLALILAAAHKKRLFPWQTIRTFNPPSGLMGPRDYERSFVCPPNLRRHGRLGKRDPKATWTDDDGIVIPFGFLARTHLPVTIPLGRLPNKNMFIVAPSGSGKTTLMRAIIKALLAKPCVVIALEAKANDPALDEKKEGFKHTLLPEAAQAGFNTLYFNPLDADSIHWNPLDLDPITFASSIVVDVNSLPPEEQHWAERDHGYIAGLAQLLKWGAVMVAGEDENGQPAEVAVLPCNPRGLMRLVNNRRNIVESLRRLKSNPDVDAAELSELTQTLSSIIRTDTDWDKNIQGVRGRLRMFKNPNVLRCTERSNIDMRAVMHQPTVLIFGAPASMGPDAESLASVFVYQLQQALHTRYGTASVLPLFAFFDEYQTLNIDLAGRLSAIVRGANGGLTVILQNISQIAKNTSSQDPSNAGTSELKTIFSNSAIRVCLHNADESTAKFFSDEIGKHAIIVPGISDHYDSNGFGIFPTSWNRIHSQQVVPRVDSDGIKRMEKHHALVYLSPAGDPVFGECKPFMVDLRGIEEIARLHLLHNVTGRSGGPDGSPDDGGAAPLPPFVSGPGGSPPTGPSGAPAEGVGGKVQNIIASFMQPKSLAHEGTAPASPAISGAASAGSGERLCPHCHQHAGKGRFCIECGRFIGQAQDAAPARVPAAESIMPVAAPAAPAAQAPVPPSQYMDAAQSGKPAFPFSGANIAEESGQRYPAQQQAAPAQQQAAPAQQQAAPAYPAAQPAAPNASHAAYRPEAVRQQPDPGYQQPAEAHQQPGAPAHTPGFAQLPPAQGGPPQPPVAQPGQRQPLTSLHGDMSRYGVPQIPGQQRPKPGVEF